MQLTHRPGRVQQALRRRAAGMRRDERGLTLVELIVVIAILGVIAIPLGNALFAYFHNTNATVNRLGVQHDAQIAAAYFTQDVQSMGQHNWSATPDGTSAAGYPLKQSVWVNLAATATPYPCGSTGTTVVRLVWDDPTAVNAPTTVVVAYTVVTVGTEKQLHRVKCVGSGSPVDLVLVHNLDSASTPSVACADASGTSVACAGTGAAGSPIPQRIQLTLALKAPNSTDPALSITLTGQRRQT
jgi:prepilin-type N-terminal cleavage/methylation domain-containing protein